MTYINHYDTGRGAARGSATHRVAEADPPVHGPACRLFATPDIRERRPAGAIVPGGVRTSFVCPVATGGMRVLRGRAASVEADRGRTQRIIERATEAGEPALRVWTPHRHVAFGRRDANAEGYDRAREFARERGYPPVERQVGGRAVAYTGSTVAFSYTQPGADRTAIDRRYADAVERVRGTLADLGVDASEGEPEGAFCPGTHSLQAQGKVAGLAQRVRRDVAVVGGIVVVRDRGAIADVLEPVHDALGIPFERDAVGSVASAGGPEDPATVCDVLVDAFADGDIQETYTDCCKSLPDRPHDSVRSDR